jgi:hypothetical protein
MGKRDRDEFRTELEKLSQIRGDGDDYLAQNRRTAEAEDKCGPLDRFIVRNSVD